MTRQLDARLIRLERRSRSLDHLSIAEVDARLAALVEKARGSGLLKDPSESEKVQFFTDLHAAGIRPETIREWFPDAPA